MLGVDKKTPYRELIQIYRERVKKPIKPKEVKTGPVKQNILKGDDIDLTALPVPKWHHLDGGRYMGTFDGVVTKDPETGWVNIGLYRRMIHDKRHSGISVPTGQHMWMHWRKYRKLGKPMPIAMINGWDPGSSRGGLLAATPRGLRVRCNGCSSPGSGGIGEVRD